MNNSFGEIGLIDSHRSIFPDRRIYPFCTIDYIHNKFAHQLDPDRTTRVRLDYFWTRGITLFDVSMYEIDYSDHYPVSIHTFDL